MLPSASVWLDGGIGNRQSYYQKAIQFANSRFGPQFGRGAASGVSSNGCVGNKGVGVAPREEHRSEHGFGECEAAQILQAVNPSADFGGEDRCGGFGCQ